ncbi:MAG: serine--tRNA ligase [Thermoplasmataceae archaeon]|jgi:seryl-tRNA synthetase
MIDVKLLREHKELFYDSCRKRFMEPASLDRFFALDEAWRQKLKAVNDLKHHKNEISIRIADLVKSRSDASDLKKDVRELGESIEKLETELSSIDKERNEVVRSIPNLVHESVPVCKGDENNAVVRYIGNAVVHEDDVKYFKESTPHGSLFTITKNRAVSHVDLLEKLGLIDMARAGKAAGARFYYLKNRLVKLEMALMNYAVDFLSERGFTVVEPPFMLNYASMNAVTDLETFKDALYKIEGEDLYLIATAEHPIGAMLKDEILEESELPLRLAGISPCFRKEAGAHGKDTKGIFRVHQFNKIEQFVFCKPEHSWDFLEELLKNAEDFCSSLGIAYRVVNICSGELSVLNAKKYDIEAWFPAQGKFREVVSASNNTDYQGRSLNIRYRSKNGNQIVNTLNSTEVATTRMLVAITENFQQQDNGGISIPKALVPYTGFDFISS